MKRIVILLLIVLILVKNVSAITINESADPDVQRDIIVNLSKLIPENKIANKL